MTYLPDMHSYLHQSSLLIQAYPTTRVTTKYSLPRRPNPNSTSKRSKKAASITTTTGTSTPAEVSTQPATTATPKEKREPAATLTLKTYHADTGICLKYRTDKAQEVGRLLTGLGRLAKGEVIEMPSTATGAALQVAQEDKMEIDIEAAATTTEGALKDGKAAGAVGKSSAEMTQTQSQQQSGGSKKKKKGKK